MATALFAWLQIRSLNGNFILRIEDIDTKRSKPEFVDSIIEDLNWLGITWDEGPGKGNFGPYIQSQRTTLYQSYFEELQHGGFIYPCFCSRAEMLSAVSAPHGLESEGEIYIGPCRKLSAQEIEERSIEKNPAYRFKAERGGPVDFEDLIFGKQHFDIGFGGDFTIVRSDGAFAYQLAVVVDDALQGISHVLRGYDLLDSTPRQLMLYAALGLRPPVFSHIPLYVDASGVRLSKRQGGISIKELRSFGCTAEDIIGKILFNYGLIDRHEPLDLNTALQHYERGGFRLTHAIFNV